MSSLLCDICGNLVSGDNSATNWAIRELGGPLKGIPEGKDRHFFSMQGEHPCVGETRLNKGAGFEPTGGQLEPVDRASLPRIDPRYNGLI